MARLDHVKNLTSLVDWYGGNARLRRLVNLVIVGGVVDPEAATDEEERQQCRKMHGLLKHHGLQGEVRWLVAQKNRVINAEIYRCVSARLQLRAGCSRLQVARLRLTTFSLQLCGAERSALAVC